MSDIKRDRAKLLRDVYMSYKSKSETTDAEKDDDANTRIMVELLPEDNLFVKQIQSGHIPRVR